MAPIDAVQFQGRIATSPFLAKYGATIDRHSAHEMITARIVAAARQATRCRDAGQVSPRRPRPA